LKNLLKNYLIYNGWIFLIFYDSLLTQPEKKSIYSYKEDEFRKKIPTEHLQTTNPEKQRKNCKEFFEKNVNLWNTYYDAKEGNPYKHNLVVLKSILKNYDSAKTLLDLGCGTGIPLLEFLKMGFSAKGCDFIERSLDLTKQKLKKHGYNDDVIFYLDIEDSTTIPSEKFDIITSVGLFPHITDDKQALQNTKSMLNDNGTVLIQFRNDLFNLFTLNAYSEDFFKRLIDFDTLPNVLKKSIDDFYAQNLSTAAINSQFGLISKFHNPLNIENELFKPMGFEIKNIHFFHYHRLPPIFQTQDNDLFRKLSDEIEDPSDWRGHFLASSFIVEAQLK